MSSLNYIKLNREKLVIFTISSFLTAQYALVSTPESLSEKQRIVLLISDFYISFYIEVNVCPLNITFLQKTRKGYKF